MDLGIYDRNSNREKVLCLILVVVFFFLLFLQVVCQRDPFGFAHSLVERLEGVAWSSDECYQLHVSPHEVARIEIAILKDVAVFPPVSVLVNGHRVASFNKGSVQIAVRDGDEILIDGSRHKKLLTFRIKRLWGGLRWPPSDYIVSTCSSLVSLGRVKMRDYHGWGD